MQTINKYRLSGIFVAAVTTPVTAYAANFDFSFTGGNGVVVMGEIFGLAPNGQSSATDIIVDSGPVIPPLGYPLNVFSYFTVTGPNAFTVSHGNIVGASFVGQKFAPGQAVTLLINASFLGARLNAFDNSGVATYNYGGYAADSFTPVRAPEPASIALLGAGLAGISAFRRRRQAG